MKVVIALLLSLLLLAPTGALAGGNGNGNGNGSGNGQSNANNGNGNNGNGNSGNNGNGNAYGQDKSGGSALPLAPGVDDQNAALTALQSGAALPLSQIIPLAYSHWGGKIIDATLVRRQGVLLYELTIISDQGVSSRVYCDARTGNPVNP